MHFYKFHISDYISATPHLTNAEDLAYRRMLDLYYSTEAPIPTDIPWVSRRLRIDPEVCATVLHEFFEKGEDGWHNARCDADIKDFVEYIDKQRRNGKRGGRPRSKAKKPSAKPVGKPPQTQGKPNVKPSRTHNPEPITQKDTPPKSPKKDPKKEEKELPKYPSFEECKHLLPDCITADLWKEYLKNRKHKNAPVTERVLKRIKTGLDQLVDPVTWFEYVLERQWQGVFPEHRPVADVIQLEKDGVHPFGKSAFPRADEKPRDPNRPPPGGLVGQ